MRAAPDETAREGGRLAGEREQDDDDAHAGDDDTKVGHSVG